MGPLPDVGSCPPPWSWAVPCHRRAFWAPFGSWPRSSPWQCSAHLGRSAHPPPGTEQYPGKGCPFPPSGLQHNPWTLLRTSPWTFPRAASRAQSPTWQGHALLAAQGTNSPRLRHPTQKPWSCCPGSHHGGSRHIHVHRDLWPHLSYMGWVGRDFTTT